MYQKAMLITLILSSLLAGCATTPPHHQRHNTDYSNTFSPPMVSANAESSLSADSPIWQADSLSTWNKLQHTSSKTLAATRTDDPMMDGWIKLAIISKRYSTNTAAMVPSLIAWRQQFPNHPGNELFPDNNTLSSIQSGSHPQKIAVLLPLQGQFAASGKAVREGFLGSYYNAMAKNQPVPNIAFYDTSLGDVNAVYQKAVSEGADIVVGPLLKDQVQTVTNQRNLTVPTIALNYTTKGFLSLPHNLYQFGLSPNDEAKQLADKAIKSGSRAIIIAPETAWGRNVTKTLTDQWQAVGGSVIDSYYFQQNANFAQDIPRLLHINPQEDQRRTRSKGNTAQDLERQRRQDFDVVFLLAPSINARQIVPLLHFYYLQNIPIFSTSVVYEGSPSPQRDNDLNGVHFCDTPWTLKMQGHKMQSNRLYAVGRDAYLISQDLNRMSSMPNFPIYGTTGALTLTSDHQIYRRLAWAEFHEGRPS